MGRSKHSDDKTNVYKTGSVKKAEGQIKEHYEKTSSKLSCTLKSMEYDAKTGKCV